MNSCNRLDKAALPPWSYDATYQLTGEHRTGTTPYEDTYSYDAAGNRLTKVHDGARTTYSYDAANQLEWSEDASGRTTYTFDADGNQQVTVEPNGDRTTNTWDYENRMTQVELPSGIRNTMAYEPGGLRVKLEESTRTKKFVWDGQNYLAETDEHDDTQVVYTNEPRLYGNLVSQHAGSGSHWYHFDAIGSTRELTDEVTLVTGESVFDAWGSLIDALGVLTQFRWCGQTGFWGHDEHTFVFVRDRYYVAPIARWISVDALKHVHNAMSQYCFANNRPLVLIDPSGMQPEYPGTYPPAPPQSRPQPKPVWDLFEQCWPEGFNPFGPPDPPFNTWPPRVADRPQFEPPRSAFPFCNDNKNCQEVFPDPLHDGYPISEEGNSIKRLLASQYPIDCEVIFKYGDCGLPAPNLAVTCEQPPGGKGKIYICVQSGTSQCVAEELLAHELVHAWQHCKGDFYKLTCEKKEEQAYAISCRWRFGNDCIFDGSPGYSDSIDTCVKDGIVTSCATLPGQVSKKEVCDEVFKL